MQSHLPVPALRAPAPQEKVRVLQLGPTQPGWQRQSSGLTQVPWCGTEQSEQIALSQGSLPGVLDQPGEQVQVLGEPETPVQVPWAQEGEQ